MEKSKQIVIHSKSKRFANLTSIVTKYYKTSTVLISTKYYSNSIFYLLTDAYLPYLSWIFTPEQCLYNVEFQRMFMFLSYSGQINIDMGVPDKLNKSCKRFHNFKLIFKLLNCTFSSNQDNIQIVRTCSI